MTEEINEKPESKPDFNLILTGKLEIQFDKNHATITEIDITAKTLNQLIHKLLDKITRVSLSKLNHVLQMIVEN